jgi:integrase
MKILVNKRYRQKDRKGGFTWYADIRVRQGKGRPALRLRENIPGVTTKHDAEREAKVIAERFYDEHFGPPKPKDKPLAEFIKEDYVPWAENNKKQPRHDRGVTRIWLELPSLKGKTVREVSSFDIESAKIARRKAISRYGHAVAPQMVNRELIIMSSLFHHAMEWKYREDNPCKGVKRFDVAAGTPSCLSWEDEELLMAAAWNGPDYLPRLIQLGTGTGMRQCEMRHLRKEDVDLVRGTLYVTDTKWKNDPRRTKGIPLSSEIVEMLREWMSLTSSEWVFPSPQDARRPIAQPTINQALTYACQRAKIKTIGFHALRHAFGTRLGEAGERLEVIAELMGHSKIEMTRVYVHPSLGSKKEAVKKVLVTYWSREARERKSEKAG